MKKIIYFFVTLLIVALISMPLYSCGSGDNSNNNSNNGNSNTENGKTQSASEQRESDKTLLESKGFTVSVYTSDLGSVAAGIGSTDDKLDAFLTARSSEDAIMIYYFKSESDAKACYQGKESTFKLVGKSLVYGDTKNLFKESSSSGNNEESSSSSKNNIDWNGNFYGVELPKVANYDKVCEYTVKDDSITIRIEGVTYAEFIEYCQKLEGLSGWERDEDENVDSFPSDYNSRDKVYFSGAYQSLPHIAVQYYSDSKVNSSGYPHFVIFVYNSWF